MFGRKKAPPPPPDAYKAIRNFGLAGWSFPTYKQPGTTTAQVPFLELILVFSFVVFAWELYLDIRQYRALQKKDVPAALTTRIAELDQAAAKEDKGTKETLLSRLTSKFDAARRYSIDKAHLGFVEGIFSQAESTALLLLGSMPWAWDLSARLAGKWGKGKDEYVVSLIFMGLNMAFENVINLPFALYSTFVVESRHGFNKQSVGDFFLDKLKAILLSAVLGGPMISAVIYVVKAGGPNFFYYLYLLVLVFQLLLLTLYPTVIAPLFNKYEPLEDGPLKTQIDALASRVKFPLTKVFVVDGSRRTAHSNAYFFGFFKSKRIVLFDTLIQQVAPSELLSILGHEIGHWAHGHTLQMFAVSQLHLFAAFYLFSASLHNEALYASFGFSARPTIIGLFLFFQAVWAPIDKALSFVFTLWTRKNEFQADRYAVDLGYAEDLQRGLVKLQIENLSNPSPDPWFSFYHYSHPPLTERLAAISARQAAAGKKRA